MAVTLLPRQPFGVKFYATTTAITFRCMSFSSAPISITMAGQTKVSTPVKVCDDRSPADAAGETWAGWKSDLTFTGLMPLIKYPYTATQGANTITATAITMATKAQNHRMFFVTCFHPDLNANSAGAHDYIRQQAESGPLPVTEVLHMDDLIYSDKMQVVDTVVGKSTSATPDSSVTRQRYNYGLTYISLWSLLEDTTSSPIKTTGQRDSNYAFTSRNVGSRYMYGDHEFFNDIAPAGASVPNAYHETAGGYNGVGLRAWNECIKDMRGTPANIEDANAQHWYFDYGALRVVVIDNICNYDLSTAVLTEPQVRDVLNALQNTDRGFKIFARPWGGIRSIAGETNHDAKTPLFSDWGTQPQGEYDTIWALKTPPSGPVPILSNPATNGDSGLCINVRGDWHTASVARFEKAGDATHANEKMLDISLGTVTGSLTSNGFIGNTDGVTVEWQAPGNQSDKSCLQVDVYGAENPPRMVLTMVSSLGSLGQNFSWQPVWTKEFTLWHSDSVGNPVNVGRADPGTISMSSVFSNHRARTGRG